MFDVIKRVNLYITVFMFGETTSTFYCVCISCDNETTTTYISNITSQYYPTPKAIVQSISPINKAATFCKSCITITWKAQNLLKVGLLINICFTNNSYF